MSSMMSSPPVHQPFRIFHGFPFLSLLWFMIPCHRYRLTCLSNINSSCSFMVTWWPGGRIYSTFFKLLHLTHWRGGCQRKMPIYCNCSASSLAARGNLSYVTSKPWCDLIWCNWKNEVILPCKFHCYLQQIPAKIESSGGRAVDVAFLYPCDQCLVVDLNSQRKGSTVCRSTLIVLHHAYLHGVSFKAGVMKI